MNLKSLEYFLEVAKELNITSAAQRLYISQQALSLQIQKLERYYHVTLFERQPKLKLTDAGKILAESAAAILKENEYVVNRLSALSDNHRGTLRVGISALRATECLPLAMPKFNRQWPHITLQFIEKAMDEMIPMLCEGDLDILIAPALNRFDSRYPSDRIDFTFLVNEGSYVVCSDVVLKRYFGDRADEVRERSKRGIDLREFAQVPFLLEKRPMLLRRMADEYFYAAGIKPNIYIETNKTDLIISIYSCHLGAFFCRSTRLPMLMSSFPDCNAFPISGAGPMSHVPIYLMRRKGQRPPAHVATFIEIMKEAWKQLAPSEQ